MDAGCGVGGAMLWLEKHEPSWRLEGFTLSPAQHEYIQTRLAPSHRFTAQLRSYDEPASDALYDAIYSVRVRVLGLAIGLGLGLGLGIGIGIGLGLG